MKHRKLLQQNRLFLKTKKIIAFFVFFPILLWSDAHIFVYHRFGDDRYKSTSISITELKKEFDFFKKNGYKVIKLSKLINAVKEKKEIDDKWVVLTIDDGYKSFYDNGLDIFKKYNYDFTVFVYVEATQKRYSDFCTWDQLREIAKYGDVEYHSYSHPHMTFKSDDWLKKDFQKGLRFFEKGMGYKPKYFAYPYGEFDERVKNIAKSFGFEAILNQNIGAIGKGADIYDLDRNALTGTTHLIRDLRYKELNLEWLEPKRYPKNGILKQIMAKLPDKNIKNLGYYLSGYGWHKVEAKGNILKIDVNKKLLFSRNRIVLSSGNKIKTKLLIKDKYEH